MTLKAKFWFASAFFCVVANMSAELQELWRTTLTNANLRAFAAADNGDLSVLYSASIYGNGAWRVSRVGTDGAVLWTVPLTNAVLYDAHDHVACDSFGNTYIVAQTNYSTPAVLSKLTASGSFAWQVLIGVGSDVRLAIDSGGDVVTSFVHESPPASLVISKYDPDGRWLWTTNIMPHVSVTWNHSLAVGRGGEVYAATRAYQVSTFAQVSASGSLRWSRNFQRAYFDTQIMPGEEGVTYFRDEEVIGRFSDSGDILWSYTNANVRLVAAEPGNGVLSAEKPERRYDALVYRNAQGETRWQSPMFGDLAGAAKDGAGNYVLATWPDYYHNNLYVVSITPEGEQTALGTVPLGSISWRTRLVGVADGSLRIVTGRNIDDESRETSIIAMQATPAAGIPRITKHPDAVKVVRGQTATLWVEAEGGGTLAYQWYLNGNPVGGNSNSAQIQTHWSSERNGVFVAVSNAFGIVRSRIAEVHSVAPPFATYDSRERTVAYAVDSAAQFEAHIGGSEPMTYQWRRNGLDIPGETNRWLRFNSLQSGHAADYSVVVANWAGSLTANVARIVISPQVTEQWRHVTWSDEELSFPLATVSEGESLYVADGRNLTKYAPDGSVLWSTNEAGTQSADTALAVVDSGVLAVTPWQLTKYNAHGELQWRREQGGFALGLWSNLVAVSYDKLYFFTMAGDPAGEFTPECDCDEWHIGGAVIPTANGGFIAPGSVLATNSAYYSELALTWVDANRATLAFRRTGFPAWQFSDDGRTIGLDRDGNLFVAGIVEETESGVQSLLILKYDGAGQQLWRKTVILTPGEQGFPLSLRVGTTGVFVASGRVLLKVDHAGQELWRMLTGNMRFGASYAASLGLSADGSVYVLGNNEASYLVLEKLTADGTSAWVATLPLRNWGLASLTETPSGAIYVSTTAGEQTTTRFVENLRVRAPQVAQNPEPFEQFATMGESRILQAVVTGEEPITYQWYSDALAWNSHSPFEGATYAIPGRTGPTLALTNLSFSHTGYYFLEARNAHGYATTRAIRLDVGLRPEFRLADGGPYVSAPFSRVHLGGSATLQAKQTVWGVSAARYQWSKDGVPIPGATNASLVIENASHSDAAAYSLIAINDYGSHTESVRLYVEATVATVFETRKTGSTGDAPLVVRAAINNRDRLYLLGVELRTNAPSGWFLSKYSPEGELLWKTTETRANRLLSPIDLKIDSDGNILVAGNASWNAEFPVLARYASSDGRRLWHANYSSEAASRRATAMAITPTGEAYLCGTEVDWEQNTNRIFLAKFSADGQTLWDRRIPWKSQSIYGWDGADVALVPDGGVYLASGHGLTRWSGSGEKHWRTLSDLWHVEVTSAGNVYVSGKQTAKVTENGEIVWSLEKLGRALQAKDEGILLATGFNIERLSPQGEVVWTTWWERAMTFGPQGKTYVAGGSAYVRSLNQQGIELWQAKDALPEKLQEYDAHLAVYANGDVAVAHVAYEWPEKRVVYRVNRYRPTEKHPPESLQISGPGHLVRPGRSTCLTVEWTNAPAEFTWFLNRQEFARTTSPDLCVTADWNTEGMFQASILTDQGIVLSPEFELRLRRPYIYTPERSYGAWRLHTLPTFDLSPLIIETSTNLQRWQTLTNLHNVYLRREPLSIHFRDTNSTSRYFRVKQPTP